MSKISQRNALKISLPLRCAELEEFFFQLGGPLDPGGPLSLSNSLMSTHTCIHTSTPPPRSWPHDRDFSSPSASAPLKNLCPFFCRKLVQRMPGGNLFAPLFEKSGFCLLSALFAPKFAAEGSGRPPSPLARWHHPLQGLVVMSQQLDMVATALYNNCIPDAWADKAYPSLKPLSSWVIDLMARTDALEAWYQRGALWRLLLAVPNLHLSFAIFVSATKATFQHVRADRTRIEHFKSRTTFYDSLLVTARM